MRACVKRTRRIWLTYPFVKLWAIFFLWLKWSFFRKYKCFLAYFTPIFCSIVAADNVSLNVFASGKFSGIEPSSFNAVSDRYIPFVLPHIYTICFVVRPAEVIDARMHTCTSSLELVVPFILWFVAIRTALFNCLFLVGNIKKVGSVGRSVRKNKCRKKYFEFSVFYVIRWVAIWIPLSYIVCEWPQSTSKLQFMPKIFACCHPTHHIQQNNF